MKQLKKLLLSVFVAAVMLSPLSPLVGGVFAAEDSYKFGQATAAVNDSLLRDLIDRHIAATVADTAEAAVLTAFDLSTGNPKLYINKKTGKIYVKTIYDNPEYIAMFGVQKPLVDVMSENIDFFYNDPLQYDTVQYMAREWTPKSANAATGAELLNPIETIWTFTKNLSYGILATILVVIGIMIMFRQKIGGQMLVTIQNSIPRVLMVILLITLSLPLVGLMIDFSDILMGFINHMFETNDLATSAGAINNPFGLAFYMSIYFLTGTFNQALLEAGPLLLLPPFTTLGLIEIVLVFLLYIMFLILAFKIWFMLISQFGRMFLETVLLPINILMGAIPGNEANIAMSFKRVAILILAFPVTLFLIKLAFSIVLGAQPIGLPANYVFMGQSEGTLLGSGVFNLVKLNGVIMYGILILVPSVPALLQEMLKVEPIRAIGDAQKSASMDRAKVPIIGGIIGGK